MNQTETMNHTVEAARQSAAALEGKLVCPFCGVVQANAEAACPRCTMENTPATRQATKARIGPWYVLQTRNPSAPGMKFATLLALIKKGQVTARSIVRGPTTHQLWRFAAHVKGVSREFGLCYKCGEGIEPTANICPKCQRLQEPPINPDVLLETRPPQVTRATVLREIRPAGADIIIPPTGDRELPDPLEASAEIPAENPPEREFSRTPLTSDHPSPVRPPAPRPTGQEILSPKELAAVFQLNLPPQDKPANAPRPFKLRRLVAAAVLLALLVGTAYLVYDQSTRQKVFAWAEQTYLDIRHMLAPSKVVAQPNEKPDEPAPPPATLNQPAGNHQDPTPAPPAPAAPVAPPAPKMEMPSSPAPKVEPPVVETPKPQPAPEPAPKAESPKPEPAQPEAQPAQNEPADPDAMIQQARILWRNAISAEANGDYVQAVRCYEQIKKMPPVAWPGGLDLRMEDARRHLKG